MRILTSLLACLAAVASFAAPEVGKAAPEFTGKTLDGKTVSLALSEDQAEWLEQAIAEHRKLKKLLTEMRRLSRKIMRLRFPDTERRTPLNKKVLRLI